MSSVTNEISAPLGKIACYAPQEQNSLTMPCLINRPLKQLGAKISKIKSTTSLANMNYGKKD